MERTAEQYESERREAIMVLRDICGEFGDNDWTDDLHLADILEKHLHRYLEERAFYAKSCLPARPD